VAGLKRSVVIGRPVAEVFDFAADPMNAGKLMPSVTKVEMLTEGGMRPGAKFRETRLMNGQERSAVIEISEYVRPDRYTAVSAMMGLRAAYTLRFRPEPADGSGAESTRVDLDAVVTGNLLWWPFLGMMSGMMEKEDGELLNRMKSALEQPSRPPEA
jgi:hypothetical protein